MTDRPDLTECAARMDAAIAALPDGMGRIDAIGMLLSVALTQMHADVNEASVAFSSVQTRMSGRATFVHDVDPATGQARALFDARLMSPDVVTQCLDPDGTGGYDVATLPRRAAH